MMGEPREIGTVDRGRSLERVDGLPVQNSRAGGDQPFDREASELVSERHPFRHLYEHAGSQTLLETVERLARERLQEPEFHLGRDDRHRPEEDPRLGGEAGGTSEHGVPDRERHLLVPRRQEPR